MILLNVGPGPGALRAPRAALTLAEAGYEVAVYLDGRARDFVGPAAFRAPEWPGIALDPIEEPGPVEALLFAPADAATLSRLAYGLGAGAVYQAYTSGVRPAIVDPELDPAIAQHPAVRKNLALLEEDGATVLHDASPGELVSRTLHELGGPLDGLRVVVTAGGTREPVDSVRFVGNRSSGKMGAAIAREAYQRGAEVSVVAANVSEVEPGVEWRPVETFAELREETLRLCEKADALVMAAAVSDFTPATPLLGEKIRRGGRETMTLELAATPDILSEVRERRPELFIVGFAATHGDPRPDAREKLRKKGVELVVGNDISSPGIGFGSEENEAYIVMESGSEGGFEEHFVPQEPKTVLASVILEHLMPAIKHREV